MEKKCIEEWRPVIEYKGVSFEGVYEISNYGNVRSVDRFNSVGHFLKGKMLTKKTDIGGYVKVSFYKNGKQYYPFVHRLIASAFPEAMYTPWFEGAEEINHRDENKQNNYVDTSNPENSNLEWCTKKYNRNYGTGGERQAKQMLNREDASKKVIQKDLDGNQIKIWNSINDVERAGFNRNSVKDVLHHRKWRKTSGGFIWEFLEEKNND